MSVPEPRRRLCAVEIVRVGEMRWYDWEENCPSLILMVAKASSFLEEHKYSEDPGRLHLDWELWAEVVEE